MKSTSTERKIKNEQCNFYVKHFKKVKGYYDSGLWSIERVRNAVIKSWITEEEFRMITGENIK